MNHGYDTYGRREHRAGFDRAAGQFLDYLRSRTADHWIMFLAGLVIGSLLG